MKISNIQFYKYELPLKNPFMIKGNEMKSRQGFIIRIVFDGSIEGLGEIAPLSDYSIESIEKVKNQLDEVKDALEGLELENDLIEMKGELAQLLDPLEYFPSVRFGIESAIINGIAAQKGLPLNKMINDECSEEVFLTGLLQGDCDQVLEQAKILLNDGYQDFKLKVGGDVNDDILKVKQVNELIAGHAMLHVDCNQQYTYDDCLEFTKTVGCAALTYIEEPFKDFLKIPEFYNQTLVPVALDESFVGKDLEHIKGVDGIDFLILKPTMIGSIEKVLQIARQAIGYGIKPIISSAFETSVGITTLAHLASCLKGVKYTGLDTFKWFERDLIKNIGIRKGMLFVKDLPLKLSNLTSDELTEIH